MLARQETLRSRSPERVEQESWATLLAYNLVRSEMERLASARCEAQDEQLRSQAAYFTVEGGA